MNRLRNRLIAIFLLATLVPLAGTVWIVRSLLEYSLSYSTTEELDGVSQSLATVGRELYQRAQQSLKQAAQNGVAKHRAIPATDPSIQTFVESNQPERFQLEGDGGNRLVYLVRKSPREVWRYEEPLGAVGLDRVREQHADARALIERNRERDLRRGFLYAFLAAAAVLWLGAFAALVFFAHRVSQPIQQLTAALRRLGAGDSTARVPTAGTADEVGQAIASFNEMAEELAHSRDRLLFFARLESWQALARKMAHEVKNSLTPIRLTVEEMVARHGASDPAFLEQAAQIVTDEVTGLERRVRAFSELAAEPPVRQRRLDLNALANERIAFLRHGNTGVIYQQRLDPARPAAWADDDLTRGILTNLLENAAHAAGPGGVVLVVTRALDGGQVCAEVHDSGPGLSTNARRTLFEPTISFKKTGMGLGLSIARKSALLNAGDIHLIDGELGGAAFRVVLPAAPLQEDTSCEPVSPSSTTKKTSAVPSA